MEHDDETMQDELETAQIEPVIEANEDLQEVLDEDKAEEAKLEKEVEDFNCQICHLPADGLVIDTPLGICHSSCWEIKISENSEELENIPGVGARRVTWY